MVIRPITTNYVVSTRLLNVKTTFYHIMFHNIDRCNTIIIMMFQSGITLIYLTVLLMPLITDIIVMISVPPHKNVPISVSK